MSKVKGGGDWTDKIGVHYHMLGLLLRWLGLSLLMHGSLVCISVAIVECWLVDSVNVKGGVEGAHGEAYPDASCFSKCFLF